MRNSGTVQTVAFRGRVRASSSSSGGNRARILNARAHHRDPIPRIVLQISASPYRDDGFRGWEAGEAEESCVCTLLTNCHRPNYTTHFMATGREAGDG